MNLCDSKKRCYGSSIPEIQFEMSILSHIYVKRDSNFTSHTSQLIGFRAIILGNVMIRFALSDGAEVFGKVLDVFYNE